MNNLSQKVNDKKQPFQTRNTFTESYEAFQKTTLFQKLNDKFSVKPYYVRYSAMHKLALITSYAFNVLSAITAATAVYFFIQNFIGNIMLSGGITCLFMTLLELAKRITGSNCLQNIFQFRKFPIGLLSTVAGLVILSVLFSFNGSKKAIREFVDPPAYINIDSMLQPYKTGMAKIDNQIEKARQTTYRGNTTRTSQLTINKLTDQQKDLQDKYFAEEKNLKLENQTLENHFIKGTEKSASHFALFTLGCELFFLMSLIFLEYYDYRSYGEFSTSLVHPVTGQPTTNKDGKYKLVEKFRFMIAQEVQKGHKAAQHQWKQHAQVVLQKSLPDLKRDALALQDSQQMLQGVLQESLQSETPLQNEELPLQEALQSVTPLQGKIQEVVPLQEPLQSETPLQNEELAFQETLQNETPLQGKIQEVVPLQKPLQSVTSLQNDGPALQKSLQSETPLQNEELAFQETLQSEIPLQETLQNETPLQSNELALQESLQIETPLQNEELALQEPLQNETLLQSDELALQKSLQNKMPLQSKEFPLQKSLQSEVPLQSEELPLQNKKPLRKPLQGKIQAETTLQASKPPKKPVPNQAAPENNIKTNKLKAEITQIKSRLRTAEYRLKNSIGKKTTNASNIRNATEKLEELMQQLEELK